jgi:hypothetical protein
MLLLQLDMLAYIDRSADLPTLVIGAGIPTDWLSRAMSVSGRSVEGNLVNWAWDGRQMKVQITGTEKMAVKLGVSFPRQATINVVTLPASA